ncbi:MAG: ATP-dependent DNA helicase DinG [Ketobacteraceae bacterium]|nr:ATP-dependent DNA helicase DinG [Ketobacteraceae bacterium]
MLSDDIKLKIQSTYTHFLKAKALKPRYGQRLMIAEVAKSLAAVETDSEGKRTSENHICVVEAGTGTGKTVAYLVAVIPIAQALKKKVVISTATVALQDQIVSKDIPDLLMNSPLRFSYQLAKGRGRYLCLSQLDRLLSGGGEDDPNMALWEEMNAVTVDKKAAELYQSMDRAIRNNEWHGDRDQWPDEIRNEDWFRVTTDQHRCTNRNCSYYEDCTFYMARNDMHRTEVIVANHDLVLADLALGGGVVLPPPEDTIYIFDEGHHLPDKALKHFSASGHVRGTQIWLEELRKLADSLSDAFPSVPSISHTRDKLGELADEMKQQLGMVLSSLTPLASEEGNAVNESGRIVYRFPEGSIPQELQHQGEELYKLSGELFDYIDDISTWLAEALDGKHSDVSRTDAEAWYPLVGTYAARAGHLVDLWMSFSQQHDPGRPVARWLNFSETAQGLDVELSASPVLANEVLTRYLWNRCFAAVVTSATLMAVGSFDRFRMRSGVPADSQFHSVPSPFDYQQAARLVVPPMDFDPSDTYRHTHFLVDYLLRHGMSGAVLVLFTSRRQLEDALALLPADFAGRVFAQGEYGKAEIIRRHKERVDEGLPSIIFGLASFAEGIDLPGEYCDHVIIAKLPFSVPEEPVDATLAEWIKARGGNPFMQIAVPDAAIKLKQAVGRLIRTEFDAGVISVLDRRLTRRQYGKAIVKSLPPIPVLSDFPVSDRA